MKMIVIRDDANNEFTIRVSDGKLEISAEGLNVSNIMAGQPEWDMNDYNRDFEYLGISRGRKKIIIKSKVGFILDGMSGIHNELEIDSYGDLEVSDGYHTMDELYQHRMALNIALSHMMYRDDAAQFTVWKSKLHHDGTMFENYFIVMAINSNTSEQISYHYHMKYWDLFKIPEVERAPKFDGHTSQDVIERLMRL